MEIVKKNLFSVICGAVALLAFIAWFWPVGGMYSSFSDDLQKRVDLEGQIKSLKSQARIPPPLDGAAAPKELTAFPNKATIDEIDRATKELGRQSGVALKFVVELNSKGHELLEPGSLPAPIDNNTNFHFRSAYNAVMDYGGKPDPWNHTAPQSGPFNLLDQVLVATPLARDTDIKDALDKKWAADYQPRVYKVNGQDQNLPDVQAEFQRDTANFVKEFHRQRASNFKIYCEADGLTRAPNLTPDMTPSANDIWFGQMTLWVEQDVCRTIAEMNKDVLLKPGQGIAMSPVKNLIDVAIQPNIAMYTMGTAPTAAAGEAAQELDPSKRIYTNTPTGRVCNTLYDVVSFNVTAVVDARHLTRFLQTLRYGQLITVKQMSIQDVDVRAAEDVGYVYGPARCVQVSLECEELFMRDWTVRQLVADPNHPAPMPLDVQKKLGITPPAPAAAPTPNVAMQ